MTTALIIFAAVAALMCVGLGYVVSRRGVELRRLAYKCEALDETNRNLSRFKSEAFQMRNVPRAADWTAADRDTMASLLASDFGKKLITRLQATEYVLAVTNAQQTANTAHAAGVTCGYNQCLRQILSLSQSACVVAEKPNDSGAADGEPRPIEREASEYEARMSP